MNLPLGFGTLDWEDWFYGLISSFISGGANAIVAGVVVNWMDPNGDFNPTNLRFYILITCIFIASGLLNMFSFLRTKPLPTHKTVKSSVETHEKKSPAKTTITRVEETHIEPMDPPDPPKP